MVTDVSDGPGPFAQAAFRRFWLAGSVSEFGTYITTVALSFLGVDTLRGSLADVGLVNASRWAPYLLFGLVAGALVERRRRKAILVGADLGRGVLLGLVLLLWISGILSIPVLMVLMALFGLFSLVGDAATMSFLPRIVPRGRLLAANARIDQSSAVAQTSGRRPRPIDLATAIRFARGCTTSGARMTTRSTDTGQSLGRCL